MYISVPVLTLRCCGFDVHDCGLDCVDDGTSWIIQQFIEKRALNLGFLLSNKGPYLT